MARQLAEQAVGVHIFLFFERVLLADGLQYIVNWGGERVALVQFPTAFGTDVLNLTATFAMSSDVMRSGYSLITANAALVPLCDDVTSEEDAEAAAIVDK
eukprot:2060697-Prymnesium_polylepis.1